MAMMIGILLLCPYAGPTNDHDDYDNDDVVDSIIILLCPGAPVPN